MTYRTTITLDDDAYNFLQAHAGRNRSGFINSLLRREQQARLAQRLRQANLEEASDADYQEALTEWGATLADGLR